jgi:flagellar protein FliS
VRQHVLFQKNQKKLNILTKMSIKEGTSEGVPGRIGGSNLAYTNALSAYRETRIKTASQGQLIIMLYDEAVKQLDRGLDLLQTNVSGKKDPGKIETIGKVVVKTQEIITELMVSLDFEQGGDISKNLFSLYTWFNKELLEANITQDMKRILTVRNLFNELRSAWAEIVAKTSAEDMGQPSAGVNIAG